MPTERLEVKGTFDDQITPGLKKVGDEAEKSEKKVKALTGADISRVGRGMLDVASKMATGLYDVAKASSNLYEQQNFVNQVFKEAAPGIEKFAKTAATSMGLSERAALEAAGSIGVFGLNVGITGDSLAEFSTNLVRLAGDMASVKNTSPEQAITALSAAFRTQYRPIKEYGVVLNEVNLKQRAMELGIYDGTGKLDAQQRVLAVNAEVFAQLGFAVGDFNRTQDQLANQTRIAQAQFENLQANLGDAVRPAFISVMQAANGVLTGLQKIPEPIKQIGGEIALMATGLLGLAGGAVFAVGKIVSLVDTAKELRARFAETRAASSGMVNALTRVAGVAGGFGVAVAGAQVLFDVINQITDVAGKSESALNRLNIAAGKGDAAGAVNAFSDAVDAAHRKVEISDFWTVVGKKFHVTADGAARDVEQLDSAWKKLTTQGQAEVIKGWEEERAQLDQNSGRYKEVTAMLDMYTPKLKETVQAAQATGEAHALSAETIAKFGDISAESADNQEEAAKAYEKAAEDLGKLAESVDEANRAFDTAKETSEAFGDSLEKVVGTPQVLDNAVAIKDAIFELTDGFTTGSKKAQVFSAALDENTDTGRKNIKAIDEVAAKISDELIRVYEESGGSIDKVNEASSRWRDELTKQLQAAGLTKDQVDKYIDTLNMTPEKITTAIELRDQEVAMKKLDMLNLEMDKLPPSISTQIVAAVDQGDYVKAWNLASGYITTAGPIEIQAVADQATATTAGTTAQGTAQTSATAAGAVNISTQTTPPTNTADTISRAQAGLNFVGPLVSEIQVKPGDVKTPQSTNVTYAKQNPPETTIETKPGDYKAPMNEINRAAAANQPTTIIKTRNDDFYVTWSTIDTFFRNHDVTTTVKTINYDMAGTWGAINSYFGSHPVNVQVNASSGDIGKAWNDIQVYFNNHPITVKVNTAVGSTTAAPTATAAGPRAATPAMQTMGLATVGDQLLSVPAPVSAGVAAPSSTPSIVNMTVHMPAGTNETRVVDLLRRYQRQNGTTSLPR